MTNVNKQDPIQIGSDQLGTQKEKKLAPPGEASPRGPADPYRHLPSALRGGWPQTQAPAPAAPPAQLSDLTSTLRAAAKNTLSNQLNHYDEKFEQWKKLQTANRYHEDITSQFPSVKDVLK